MMDLFPVTDRPFGPFLRFLSMDDIGKELIYINIFYRIIFWPRTVSDALPSLDGFQYRRDLLVDRGRTGAGRGRV
jgi:hypothetical protein